jgi:hypothetical protein
MNTARNPVRRVREPIGPLALLRPVAGHCGGKKAKVVLDCPLEACIKVHTSIHDAITSQKNPFIFKYLHDRDAK